jgi:hypothetical protein
MPVAALCAAVITTPLVARAEGDVALTDADVQRLLGPTLRSVQVEASSGGGFVALTLPNGQNIRQSLTLPRFTIPVDFLPDIQCDIQPLRSVGSPSFVYRDGWFQLHLSLRPVSGNLIARTNSFYPNVVAPQVDITMRFRLTQNNGLIQIGEIQTQTTGAIDLTGIGSPFSPTVRGRIQTAISTNVQAQLQPRLNLLVSLTIPGFLQQATGYGNTLRVSGIRHERDRVLFSVTGQTQRPPRPTFQIPGADAFTTLDPNALASALKQSDNEVAAAVKQVKKAEEAQAEKDRQLSEKYAANKKKDDKGGEEGEKKGQEDEKSGKG